MDDTILIGSENKPTRKEVIKLSYYDPVVYAALQYWRRGQLTFEEALILAVTTQAKQIETINAELKKYMMHYPLLH